MNRASAWEKDNWSSEHLSSVAAAIAACCNILSWLSINFLNYAVQTSIFHRDFSAMNYPEIISQSLWLMPLVAIATFRQVLALTLIYALLLTIVLAGCIFYLVSFILTGVGAIATLVWPGWLLFSIGAISVCIVLIWGCVLLARNLR